MDAGNTLLFPACAWGEEARRELVWPNCINTVFLCIYLCVDTPRSYRTYTMTLLMFPSPAQKVMIISTLNFSSFHTIVAPYCLVSFDSHHVIAAGYEVSMAMVDGGEDELGNQSSSIDPTIKAPLTDQSGCLLFTQALSFPDYCDNNPPPPSIRHQLPRGVYIERHSQAQRTS